MAARTGKAVTPSDTTSVGGCTAIWVGGAGNLAVQFPDGNTVTLNAVPAGTLLPIAPLRVMSTNTTATLIAALY